MLTSTLLKHYRRHPVQALFLLTGVVVANVLFTGTLLINAQARSSYEAGDRFLAYTPVGQIRHRDQGRGIEERDYVELRREGFDNLAPMVRRIVRMQKGDALELIGIDLFSMPRRTGNTMSGALDEGSSSGTSTGGNVDDSADFGAFSYPPYQVWLAPARLKQLGLEPGGRAPLANGGSLPPLTPVTGQQLGHRMLIDIGALQELSGRAGELTSILVFPTTAGRLDALRNRLPGEWEFVRTSDAPDPAALTRSFHLNLAAMGLLAFVVGVFLTYNALAFSYTDRLTLIRRLKLAGVTRAELARALLLELLLFCVIGTLLGAWLGALLASWLLPGVGRTLAQLYDVYISYPDTLLAPGVIWPALMTLLAALLCAVYPMRQALDTPVLQRPGSLWRIREVSRRDRLMALAGLSLLGLSGLGTIVAESLLPALAAMACLLLGAALLLPAVLRGLLSLLGRWVPGRNARLSWLLADTRWLLGPASLALMAMTLALVANSGLNTMIGSFRDATDRWLDQRLAADLYLRGGSERPELSAWLSEEAPELYVAVRRSLSQSRPNAGGKPGAVEIVALPAHPRYRDAVTLLRDEPDAQKRFQEGAGLFVSERAWRIDGWDAGSRLAICDALDPLPVLGIYHDYGNPRSQWMVDESLFTRCWPGHQPSGFSVLGPEGTDWNRTRARLSERFDLRDGEIIDQGTLKKAGMAVFDRTFAVSRALNALTLLVAGIGIFCAISAIHHHRLGQQALLCSLGMTRRERGALLLLQWGLLAVLSLALVWPFGTVLAGYLGAVVTPAAFGWSFPLQLEWRHFLVVALLATGSMTLAVLLPSLKLLRTSAATLLREQGT